MKALLAISVAMAVVVVPMARAKARACQDRAGHQQSHVVKPSQGAGIQMAGIDAHDQSHGNRQDVDQRGCCGITCICVLAFDISGLSLSDPYLPDPRYQHDDRSDFGFSFPPALGPPRLLV